MALVPDQKFSTFQNGGALVVGDIIVGLRGGINTKFNWTIPTAVETITGTANQVLVNGSSGIPMSGNITLTTPQDIATTSSPVFDNLTLSGGSLYDANSNIVLRLEGTANPDVYVQIKNNVVANGAVITTNGIASDIGLLLIGKGTGGIGFKTTNTAVPINFYTGTNSQHTTNFNFADTLANRTATFQDSDGTVAWLSDVAGTVTSAEGTEFQVLVNGNFGTQETGDIVLSLPQDIATTSSPQFNNIQLDGGEILDVNGNIALQLQSISSAVNYPSISNNSGNTIIYGANGTSPNITVLLTANGSGTLRLRSEATTNPFEFESGTAAQHVTRFQFSDTLQTRDVTWQDASGTVAFLSDVPSVTPAALTKTDDTNVTLTLGGTPSTALLQATSLTLGWTGQLGLTRGGTAASLTASNGGIVYSNASTLAILSGTATAGQMLQSGSSTTPAWSTTTYPATNAINTIMYASSANVLGVITPVNSAVLISSSGGVPSMSTTLPNINIGTPSAGVLTNTTGGGGVRSYQVFTSGSAATYTKPANVTSILVEVIGGGGGGGGCADPGGGNVSAAGGGGGGGYARLFIASAASTYTYTVGDGGAGGIGGNNGSPGGTTTFSASSLQATGGNGGAQGQASSVGNFGNGAAGGVGSNGNINGAGGCGGYGTTIGGALASGSGGTSTYGGGGLGRQASTGTGSAGSGYGGGGGGASASSGSAQTGGAGSAGLIVVWEFS